MVKSFEAFIAELRGARDAKRVVYFAVTAVAANKKSVFIQFASDVENATLDTLIRYVETTYQAGITNRDFHEKRLTVLCYE